MPGSNSLPDRMRANLTAAGIPFRDADLQAILEGGSLRGVEAFEKLGGWSGSVLPDYLGNSSVPEPGPAPAGSASSAPRDEPSPTRDRSDSLLAAAHRIRIGEISPVELTEQALGRITERDPALNAFQQVLHDRALKAARQAEQEIAAGRHRGPLHGVPVAIKDLLMMEGTETTAGSRILSGRVSTSSAIAVTRLEAAGAIIVGKTRMSEFAYLPGSNNAHFGPTRNPRSLERDAGGSSSGSAAAVADGMVYAALGSDTGGSVRIPAALCGIVGLKPTYGRISLHGVIPLSWSLDHLGPLTRTVDDAALLLEILAAPPARAPESYDRLEQASFLSGNREVRGLRIGVLAGRLRDEFGYGTTWDTVESSLSALEGAGAELVPLDLPELEALWRINNTILAVEAAAYHEPWLRTRLEEYGEIPRRRLLSAYAYSPTAFIHAQQARRHLREHLQAHFEQIDLLAMPTQPDGAPALGDSGWTLPTAPFNALGWPALTVPVGQTREGLPLGLQLVGKPWDEATLFRAGRLVEDSRSEP